MKLYNNSDHFKLYEGNMLDMLEVIQPNSIEAIVTDPPYELNFMGKGWDNSGIAFQAETWFKCYQVLKHGGYLLAFGGSRTYHRIACAIEDAGFEIRDTIMWLYGSGFPKSMNIGKGIEAKLTTGSANTQDWKNLQGTKAATGDWGLNKLCKEHGYRDTDYAADKHLRTVSVDYTTDEGKAWDGWGTALKPAYEPIIVARKPCEGSCIDNVLEHGVGGLNIDGCRIGSEERSYGGMSSKQPENAGCFRDDGWQPKDIEVTVNGRYPSNVILTYDETDKNEVTGGLPDTKSVFSMPNNEKTTSDMVVPFADHKSGIHYEDEGSAARYFYCAKASKKDRDEGLDQFEYSQATDGNIRRNAEFAPNIRVVSALRRNTHPTVKPCELMQYLVRLVTPKGGTVLDPFNGSGSTGKACMYENRERQAGYKYIGIEITPEYLPIAAARISYACGDGTPIIDSSGEKVAKGQMNIFELLGGNENGSV